MTASEDRILLILDLDETLVHASERPLDQTPDFRVGPYFIHRRPHLEAFLKGCAQSFHVAIWSSSSADYLGAVLRAILPPEVSPRFVWSRERCVQRLHPERLEIDFIKDLKKVKRRGFDLKRVLIVDDTPRKVVRNYGNAVYVNPYLGDRSDDELLRLGPFLESLKSVPDVRAIEKRGWRNQSFRRT